MAHSDQARKRHRQNLRHRAVNRAVKSDIKAAIKTYRAAPAGDAAKLMKTVEAKLDKAAKRKIIPTGRADRLKSRLRKFAAKAKTAPAA